MTEGIKLPNKEKIRTLWEKEINKYLETLKVATIKQAEMKEQIEEKYLRGTRKLFEMKVYNRNLVKGINILVVPLVRYAGQFLKWVGKNSNKLTRKQ